MAKTAKVKKRQPTIHSRAARRAISPSINLDKSITQTTATPHSPPSTTTTKSHILSAHNAGITKRSKSKKPMKRQQRVRQLKGLERGVDAMDKLELRVQKSVGREKKVRERSKGWEEVNLERGKRDRKKAGTANGNAFGVLEENGEAESKEREWVSDEEMPEVDGGPGIDDEVVPEISDDVKEVAIPESIPLPVATADEDEML